MSAATDFRIKQWSVIEFLTLEGQEYCHWRRILGSSLWPGKQKAIHGISSSWFSECKETSKLFHKQKKSCSPSFGTQGVCFTRNFCLKDRRWILTGIVQTYGHSSNASAESGWEETCFFCITIRQGHIAVHTLRMPWQASNSRWFHTLLTAQIWHARLLVDITIWKRVILFETRCIYMYIYISIYSFKSYFVYKLVK